MKTVRSASLTLWDRLEEQGLAEDFLLLLEARVQQKKPVLRQEDGPAK